MDSTITLPAWLAVLLVLLSLALLLDRVLIPGVRWYLRRRINLVIDEVNTRLDIEIRPFQQTRRQILIDQLSHDERVAYAVREYAREQGREDLVLTLNCNDLKSNLYHFIDEVDHCFSEYFYLDNYPEIARGTRADIDAAVAAALALVERRPAEEALPTAALTGTRELKTRERWGRFFAWSLLWLLLLTAMAGPRWDYDDVRLFHPGDNLLILLDISRSMDAADAAPSRLGRARQEIQDLVQLNREVRIGLIAFASVPHVVSPITEDSQAVRNLLPSLSTDLVRLQGSRLGQALDRARTLLAGQPEKTQHSILLISDGDFADLQVEQQVQQLAQEGIQLHVLGVGSSGGGPVPGQKGRFLTDSRRQTIESRLDEAGLINLANAGSGTYQTADFRDGDTSTILKEVMARGKAQAAGDEQVLVWNERFYWLVLPVMLLLLPGFRRHLQLEPRDMGR